MLERIRIIKHLRTVFWIWYFTDTLYVC